MISKILFIFLSMVIFFIVKNQYKIFKKHRKFRKLYYILRKKYEKNGFLLFSYGSNFKLKFPIYFKKDEQMLFIIKFADFILPVLPFEIFDKKEKQKIYENFCREGSYFYGKVTVKPGDIVIDAGAHMGIFSAVASAFGGIVYAFEPIFETRKKYLSKIAELNSKIYIIPLALSNENGEFEIEIPDFGKSVGNLAGASIVKKFKNSKKEKIKTITLDKWVEENKIEKVDFIKADIEGAERMMLEGAKNVLREFAPKLSICIYHFPDDKEVIKDLILNANPKYKIVYGKAKLYAYVEK
ncbi:MAG: FkbM family methyltransferase [Candidatus Ratteibacteria bacterium]